MAKEPFNGAAEKRAKLAKDYLTSKDFLDSLRRSVQQQMVGFGWSYCYDDGVGRYQGHFNKMGHYESKNFALSKEDMPYLQQAFDRLKKEYPELNHIRIDGKNCVVLDTKKNNLIRRHLSATGPRY